MTRFLLLFYLKASYNLNTTSYKWFYRWRSVKIVLWYFLKKPPLFRRNSAQSLCRTRSRMWRIRWQTNSCLHSIHYHSRLYRKRRILHKPHPPSAMVKRCVVGGCSNTNQEEVSLFKFPRDANIRKQWAKQIQRTRENWEPSDHSVVCSNHFTSDCFDVAPAVKASLGFDVKHKRILILSAVPTVFKPTKSKIRTAVQKRERRRVSNNRLGAVINGVDIVTMMVNLVAIFDYWHSNILSIIPFVSMLDCK